MDDLVHRLRKRAEIRRQIPTRKSVQEGRPDRISDLLEEAANKIEELMDKNCTGLSQAFSDCEKFQLLADSVFVWGQARNITSDGGATSLSQIDKLKEEVNELEEALMLEDVAKAKDGVGDSLVVLMQIWRLAGFDLVECLELAYNEIKDRKGTMINGVFVKEA